MNKKTTKLHQLDLNGLENMELMKLMKAGHDEATVMTWGVAMIARRRAGEELKWEDALQMPLRQVMELVDTSNDPLETNS